MNAAPLTYDTSNTHVVRRPRTPTQRLATRTDVGAGQCFHDFTLRDQDVVMCHVPALQSNMPLATEAGTARTKANA